MPYKSKKLKAIKTDSLDSLGDSVTDLAKWTEDEFAQLATDLQATEPRAVLYVAPSRPRQGMIVYADGTRWNPGAGEGFYEYTSGNVWVPMFASIGGTFGPFTLNAPSGITNVGNDIRLLQASTTQFGACKVDGTSIISTAGVLSVPAGMILLETITFAGASSYASSASWAGYSHIKIVISNMITSAIANTPYIQYHSNGAYQNANYVNGAMVIGLTGATPAFTNAITATTAMFIYGSADLIAADVPEGASFEIMLFNVAGTTMHKHMISQGVLRATATAYWSIATGTWTGGNTAVDGFVLANSGGATFNSGKMQIYGIK